MASTINATTSGVVTTGDTVASLALQTSGSNAVIVDSSQNVTLSKSLIISGSTSGNVTFTANAISGTQSYTLPPALPASSGYALTSTTGGVMSWASAGGGGTPGGSSTQVQYNNAGAFGGISGVTTDGTRITASTTIGVGGATPSTSGSGITFPAAISISSNVNTLDDYERGTWTPTDGSGAGLTFTVNSAIYVKIGRLVLLTCDITLPSTASTATLTVNIPFNANTPAYGQTGSFARNNKTLSLAPMTALNGLIFLAPTSFTTYIQNVAMTAGTMQFNIAYYTDA
jgi:hypothetical protein